MSQNKIQKRYNRVAPFYDSLEVFMEKGMFNDWRKELWQEVQKNLPEEGGKILEVGVGTGKNMKYYPENVKQIYAIDFSEKMLKEAKKKMPTDRDDIQLIEMNAENLKFDDNYFDVIVTSCVFCSVPHPIKGLKELKRVLKIDGRMIMLEHMRSKKPIIGPLMDMFNWVSFYIWGANINRKTIENIQKAGLNIVKEKLLWSDIVKKIVLEKYKS